jgi:hypothetical protein
VIDETESRDVSSKNTPEKWNWKFWYYDNWRRYLTTIFITYVFFIFYDDIVGHPLTNYDALMIGLIGDGIGATAKKRFDVIKSDRKVLLTKFSDDEKEL